MAPEESTETARLLRSFERHYLAARALRSFPWQSLEEKLRDSSDSELLLGILQKTVKHPLCVKHPPSVKYARCFLSELIKKTCCIAQKLSSRWSGSCRGSLLAGRTSGPLTPTWPSPTATQRHASCLPPSLARLGSDGKQCPVMTRNCFLTKSTRRWRF
ncbi:PREDICTED: protein FAM86A isoform X2 [Galeopterus variegatus]|uniref:Protein FAM86A isoform X2 n=1 Tax=Galeopterus variegatus TaxID=482537 RepID=A0ABM0QG58_GALVR|nr:PREDICTED: protein FAM86A isoform X2 [Galeopterus variegatus]